MRYLFLLYLLPSLLFAQKVKKSEAEYMVRLTGSPWNQDEACQICEDRARAMAIEKVFGTGLVQSTSLYTENTYDGEEAETLNIFRDLAESEVNGEWIQTLESSCEPLLEDGLVWVKCWVKGKVRARNSNEVELEVQPLRCERLDCQTTVFQEGEDLYLYFKAARKGYLSIYLADPFTTLRILPYREMPEEMAESIPVEADQEYILFSVVHDQMGLSRYVDEYEMSAEGENDLKRIYVLYSPEPLNKPLLAEAEEIDPVKAAQGYQMPLQLQTPDFQQWLARQRKRDRKLQVERIDLLVRGD